MAGNDAMKVEYGDGDLGIVVDPGVKNIIGDNLELSAKNTRKGCFATVCGYDL